MSIIKPITYKTLTIICCFAVIAACSPIKTGGLDKDHPGQKTASSSRDRSTLWEQFPQTTGNVEQGGRLPGDVEPEPEKTKAQELKDLKLLGKWEQGVPAVKYSDEVADYDFPVTMNRQVKYYLDFFTGKHRKNFAIWLSRSGRYLPMIHEHLRAAGLPEDLVYLAMIESGYNERAYSSAKAVGIWQFIKPTGRSYGLVINNYVDERRDPVKSTQAAVSFLSELYNEFDSWYLAVAAYNAGEGKIRRAIKKYKTTDFWEIAQGRYLKLETKRYVPKLIAAIIIAKDPAKYGFGTIAYADPLEYETVEVPRWTSLKAVALACDLDSVELKKYNNELSKEFTPPDRASYLFKVPSGKKTDVEKNLPRVQAVETFPGQPSGESLAIENPDRFTSLANAMREYVDVMDRMREGDIAPDRAPIPEDVVARAEHLKAACYYLDASMAATGRIPGEAILEQPIVNRSLDAATEKEYAAGSADNPMAEISVREGRAAWSRSACWPAPCR